MKVNKKSWHYRLNLFMHSEKDWKIERKNTLCSYFWFTVSSIIFLLIGIGIFLFMFVVAPIAMGYGIFELSGYATSFSVLNFSLWILSGYSIMGIIFLIVWLILFKIPEWYKEYKKEQYLKNSKLKKKPSLFKEFIKAKKDKVCPLIEFIDDVDNS